MRLGEGPGVKWVVVAGMEGGATASGGLWDMVCCAERVGVGGVIRWELAMGNLCVGW